MKQESRTHTTHMRFCIPLLLFSLFGFEYQILTLHFLPSSVCLPGYNYAYCTTVRDV